MHAIYNEQLDYIFLVITKKIWVDAYETATW
jgi:hypothetical protein